MKNKKGFTIVELVIVIAVIAILASVLVPTFSGIILKARRSSDVQLVKNVNTSLMMDLSLEGKEKYNTMTDALYAVKESGFEVDKIKAKSDYNIAWDSKTGLFVLIQDMYINPTVSYPTENGEETVNVDLLNGAYSEHKAADYYIVTKSSDFNQEDNMNYKNPYSIYAYNDGGWTGDLVQITVNTGFDAGDVTTFEKISYVNANADNPTSLDTIIRVCTFETRLYVYAPNDTIRFYGYSGIIDINAVDNNSFYINGVVGRVSIGQGHLCINKDSKVYCVMENENYAGAVVPTTVNYGAFVSTNKENCSGGEKNDYGVANDTVLDCGLGLHSDSVLVADNKSAYEVCSCCGYTLVTVKDWYNESIKSTLNVYDGTNVVYDCIYHKETYRMGAFVDDLIENYLGSRDIFIDVERFGISEEPLVDAAQVNSTNHLCMHEFVNPEIGSEANCCYQGIIQSRCKYCDAMLFESTPIDALNHLDNEAWFNILGNDLWLKTNYCKACKLPVLSLQKDSYMYSSLDDRYSDVTYQFSFFDTSYQEIEIFFGDFESGYFFDKVYFSLAQFIDDWGFPEDVVNDLVVNFNNVSTDEGIYGLLNSYINYYYDDFVYYRLDDGEMFNFAQNILQIYMTNMGYEVDYHEADDSYWTIDAGVTRYLDYQFVYVIRFDEEITNEMEWALYLNKPESWEDYNVDYDYGSNKYVLEYPCDIVYCYDGIGGPEVGKEFLLYPNDSAYLEYDFSNAEKWVIYNSYFNMMSKLYNNFGLEVVNDKMYGKTIHVDIVLLKIDDVSYGKHVIGSFDYTFRREQKFCADYFNYLYENELIDDSPYLVVYEGNDGYEEAFIANTGCMLTAREWIDYCYDNYGADMGFYLDYENRVFKVSGGYYDIATVPTKVCTDYQNLGFKISIYKLTN